MSRRKNKPQQPVNAAEPELTVGDALETMAAEALPEEPQLSTVDSSTEPPAEPEPATESPIEQRRDDVKPHLRCPCCWNGLGGKAERRKWQRQVSGTLVKRCYVCDQCGTEWDVDVRYEVVDGIEWVETKTVKVKPGDVKPGDAA